MARKVNIETKYKVVVSKWLTRTKRNENVPNVEIGNIKLWQIFQTLKNPPKHHKTKVL